MLITTLALGLFFAWLGQKLVIHFHVQLYHDAFLRRKAVEKPFAAQTPPRKRGYVGDFAYRNPFVPPKTQKSSFRIVHKAVLQNRRATSARMGLVSKHNSVNIMSNFYAMSRYGLRKLYFCCANIDFSVISQSTGQTFPTSSLTRDDYG